MHMCIHCGREHIGLHVLTGSFPPSIGIIVNMAALPLSEADALLCCPALDTVCTILHVSTKSHDLGGLKSRVG